MGNRMIENKKAQEAFGKEQLPRSIDITHWRDVECVCGNNEFDPVVFMKIRYNPFDPKECLSFPLEKHRCAACGIWLARRVDEKGFARWAFSIDGKNEMTDEEVLKARGKNGTKPPASPIES